jgi:hypothetical protein
MKKQKSGLAQAIRIMVKGFQPYTVVPKANTIPIKMYFIENFLWIQLVLLLLDYQCVTH